MPLALVQYDSNKVSEPEVHAVAIVIPGLLAKHLSFPGMNGVLTLSDIEVWVNPAGSLDINTRDIEIIIWAGLYPERRKNLDERRKKIAEGIRPFVPSGRTGYVWILLQPQSFEEL